MSNKDKMGLRRPPYAFTEQGIAMLSSVLKSDIAINVSIQIDGLAETILKRIENS